MAILFDAEKKIFKLDTASSSYVFAVHDSGRLLHLYYGAYLPDCDMRYLLDRGYFRLRFTPDAAGYVGAEFAPDTQPSEYSCNGTGESRISALQIRNADGNIATDIRYVSHRILSEKPALPGMPSLRDENGDSETLEVTTLEPNDERRSEALLHRLQRSARHDASRRRDEYDPRPRHGA